MSALVLRTARPAPHQAALLRAAFLDDEGAFRQWESVRSSSDPLERQFLPALFRSVERNAWETDRFDALQQDWRESWAMNVRQLHAVAKGLEALSSKGIDSLLLKGAALVADGSTPDLGTRVMSDVDALVPFARATDAATALTEAGWRMLSSRTFDEERTRGHSVSFLDADNHQVDLHWRALFDPADDSAVLRRRVPAELVGQPTFVPSPADQLVLTCLHGIGWHGAPLRWIADSTQLLRQHPDLDWDVVVSEARARRSAHRIASQLEVLQDVMGLPVPGHVVPELRSERLTLTERAVQRAKDSSHWGNTIYVCSWDHARRSRALGQREPVMSFAMIDLGLTSRRQLARRMVTRPFRHLRYRLTR